MNNKIKCFNLIILYKFFLLIILIAVIILSLFSVLSESSLNLSKANLENLFFFIRSFFPFELKTDFLIEIANNILITVSIATISLFLSLIFAIPISIIGCQSTSKSLLFKGKVDNKSLILRFLLRTNLVFLRSLPELILAIIFIRIFGLGVTAGIFAIVFTYVGFISKVFIEIIDSSNTHPYKNLIYNGASKFKAFLYGILPQCSNDLISYILFRWECALRTSIILGVVGAGGIGQQLDFAMKMMALNEVSTIILSLVLLVYISDILSYWIRKVFCQ